MFTTAEGGTRAERRRQLPASGSNEPPFKLEARPKEAVVVRAKGCWGRRSGGLRGGSGRGGAPKGRPLPKPTPRTYAGPSFGDLLLRSATALCDIV